MYADVLAVANHLRAGQTRRVLAQLAPQLSPPRVSCRLVKGISARRKSAAAANAAATSSSSSAAAAAVLHRAEKLYGAHGHEAANVHARPRRRRSDGQQVDAVVAPHLGGGGESVRRRVPGHGGRAAQSLLHLAVCSVLLPKLLSGSHAALPAALALAPCALRLRCRSGSGSGVR
jgi:hypothetical protein